MKTLAVIICLLISFISYGQLSVDSIKTEADIEKFVKQYGKQHWLDWKRNFHVLPFDYNEEVSEKNDSVLYLKWIIDDINNDGKKDLVFSNINSYRPSSRFFSLISNLNGNYDYFNLLKRQHQFYSFDFSLLRNRDTSYLLLEENHVSIIEKFTHYTSRTFLLPAFGGFVEKLDKPNIQINFDSLEFTYLPFQSLVGPLLNGLKITITKSGKIKYEESGRLYNFFEIQDDDASEYINVEHQMNVREKTKAEIYGMLSLSRFDQTHYLDSLGGAHIDQAYIRIKEGKKEKIIIDEGLEGSYWLKLFYSKMFAISKQLRTDMAKYFQQNNFLEFVQ